MAVLRHKLCFWSTFFWTKTGFSLVIFCHSMRSSLHSPHNSSNFPALFSSTKHFFPIFLSLSGFTYVLQQREGAISIGGIEDLGGASRFIEAAMGSGKFHHNSGVREKIYNWKLISNWEEVEKIIYQNLVFSPPPLALSEIQFSLFAQFSPFLFAEEEELTSGRSGDCKSLDRFCLQQLSTQKKETWNWKYSQ